MSQSQTSRCPRQKDRYFPVPVVNQLCANIEANVLWRRGGLFRVTVSKRHPGFGRSWVWPLPITSLITFWFFCVMLSPAVPPPTIFHHPNRLLILGQPSLLPSSFLPWPCQSSCSGLSLAPALFYHLTCVQLFISAILWVFLKRRTGLGLFNLYALFPHSLTCR